MHINKQHIFCYLFIPIFLTCLILFYFQSIFISDKIIIDFAVHPFNICEQYPQAWKFIKTSYILFLYTDSIILGHLLHSFFCSKTKLKTSSKNSSFTALSSLHLLIGNNEKKEPVFIAEKGLYQNMLITGTIGSGKTSSAMYPFTKQLIAYQADNANEKLGLLILDVKGNYHEQVKKYCSLFHREKDLFILSLNGCIRYNPLDKPNLKPQVLAGRLKTILTLFSSNNGEQYWLDKVEAILTECIKLCRLYNDGYVTFIELHKLVTEPDYYLSKINNLRQLFIKGVFSKEDCFNLLTSIEFFEKEFFKLDDRTLSILKSEITRITGCFVSDYQIQKVFCPLKKEQNFHGFQHLIAQGKVLVLNMNLAEYKNLAKIIAAYLKLDFQTEVLARISKKNSDRSVGFISDEFHEYVTSTDADFFAQSREAKCINIVATQSYTSLLNTLNNPHATKAIIQNLVNKLWFRTDDMFTIEDAQKQMGKEEKTRISQTISENAKTTHFNYLTQTFHSSDSNLSESINRYSQFDFIFDTNSFTQQLETFSCLSFLSTGSTILPPQKLKMFPYFLDNKGGFYEI